MIVANYIKVAVRNLLKNKIYSAINILGLSVGVACCMLIFLFSKDELSFDKFHQNKENIYRITADIFNPDREVNHIGSSGMIHGPGFASSIPEIQSYARIQSAFFNVKSVSEVIEQEALYVDDNFLSVFSFSLIYGDKNSALKELHSVVLSEDMAVKYFGRTDVVGRSLEMDAGGKFEKFVVSAVAKNSPLNSSVKIQMLLPMKYSQLTSDDKHWMNFFLNTFVVLHPGTDCKKVEQKLNSVYMHEAAAEMKEMREKYDDHSLIKFNLQPLLDMHLNTDYHSGNGIENPGNPMYSYILSAIAGFVLIIACINFINLTVARSLKRTKEIGIRKVVGSSRKQLFFQFLGESFVTSFLAFLLAIVIVVLILPFFNMLADKELSFSYLLDSKLIAGYVFLFLISGLLAGIYPALFLSKFMPIQTLYGKFRIGGKGYFAKGLVVFQFTLSAILIFATITIFSQFNYLVNFDLGYDQQNVVALNSRNLNSDEFNQFKNELKKIPSVKSVCGDQGGEWFTVAHINKEENINFCVKHVDTDFLDVFKIGLAGGRNFDPKFSGDSAESVLVNETFVKTAGWKKPIGERIEFLSEEKIYKVVGVIKDYHYASLNEKIAPQMFAMNKGMGFGKIYVKINEQDRPATLRKIESLYKQFFPDSPYRYKFDADSNLESYAKESKWKMIIACSALLTIFISCMGLFGLTVLNAEKKAKEIGIRKVLGASVASIANTLTSDFMKLVFLASLIGLPFAWWAMNEWLQNYPYHIELKAFSALLSSALIFVLALLSVGFQSVKAGMANPVKNLRTE